MNKVTTLDKVREIVAEEIQRLITEKSSLDHTGIRNVVTLASKLLEALDKFDEEATPAMKNAMTPHLDQLQKTLSDMISTPGSYVPAAPKPKVQKKVSLRNVAGGGSEAGAI